MDKPGGVPWDDLSDGLPTNLYKTVLKLESTNKVRVFHTGVSPLPMNHLERDLKRLVMSPDGNEEKNRVSFLLIPHTYGRESQESFKHLKPVHVKTYWNHIYVAHFNEECNGCSYIQFGLSLYKLERVKDYSSYKSTNSTKRSAFMDNMSEMDSDRFTKTFHFQDTFYDFLLYIADLCTAFITIVLFFTSYLIFLS